MRNNVRLILNLKTRNRHPLKRIMVVAFLFLLTVSEVSISLGLTHDPSGWNTYFVTEQPKNIDAVDIVDPSGWNYDRGTKGLKRNDEIKNDWTQQVFMFCEKVVEKGSLEANFLIENEVNTAIKAKVAEFVNKKEGVNGNLAFVRRFISLLLNTAGLPSQNLEEGQVVSGVVEIAVSTEHLKTLINFINSDVNISMRELDFILSASVHKKYIPGLPELIDQIFFLVRQKEILILVVLVAIMLCVVRLTAKSQTKTCFLKYLILLIFCASYGVEYWKLYKEAEIQQKIILDKHENIPSSCDPRNQQWWSSLFKSLGFNKDDKECLEYHKAALLDPFIEVSPSRVLSNIISDFVLSPVNKVGEAIAGFASAIFGGLPFYYGWIVWLVSCIGIFLLSGLALVILINGSIKFHWPFSGVSISRQRTPQEHLPPPAAPPVSAPPVTRSESQPLLEAVSGLSNFVLMDANSLGSLMLRAQTGMATVHSGVQELTGPPKEAPHSKSSNEKIDVSKLQGRIAGKEDSTSKTDSKTSSEKEQFEYEEIVSEAKEDRELKSPDNAQVKEEFCGPIEVLQSDLIPTLMEDGRDMTGNDSVGDKTENQLS